MALDSRKTILKIGTGLSRRGSIVNKTSILGVRSSSPSSGGVAPVAPSKSKSSASESSTNTDPSTYFELDSEGTSYFADGYYES